jgi:chloride channel protein, CIC family
MRSRPYRALPVISALIGLVLSSASWGFLELVHVLQVWVYEDLPGELGFSSQPAWWRLPWLAVAGAHPRRTAD